MLLALYLLTALVVGFPVVAGVVAFRSAFRKRRLPPATIERKSLESCEFSTELLLREWIVEDVHSPQGYALRVHALRGESDAVAVFLHGVSWNWLGSLKYMQPFIGRGWTVVGFDSRGHGESGGPHSSMGYYEKEDLGAVLDWVCARFPVSEGLFLHGFSLGGATALQYVPRDERVDGVVSDGSFTSMPALLGQRLSLHLPLDVLVSCVVGIVDVIARRLDGFSIRDVSPLDSILASPVPVLFVHGKDDDIVPWMMSLAMATSRRRKFPDSPADLLLVEGARHSGSFDMDPDGYTGAVFEFIDRALAYRRRT